MLRNEIYLKKCSMALGNTIAHVYTHIVHLHIIPFSVIVTVEVDCPTVAKSEIALIVTWKFSSLSGIWSSKIVMSTH